VEVQAFEAKMATLTPREWEVFLQVVSGQMNKQIAGRLGIREKTIKVHRARVMKKMQVNSLAELVRLTERAGVGRGPVGRSSGSAGQVSAD
jgi:FixJ family two-component response regulator